MIPGRRVAGRLAAVALLGPLTAPLTAAAGAPAAACSLVLSEHRTGQVLARLPLPPAAPGLRIAFTHSVLGTPVEDRYVFRHGTAGWQAVLVQERWQGEGYGLPHAAGPGEVLAPDPAFAPEGRRLTLQRVVQPLVVRPLPAQQMRVLVDGQPPLLLGTLAARAVHLQAEDCSPPAKDPA